MKSVIKTITSVLLVLGMVFSSTSSFAAGDTIKIGYLTSKSGVLSNWGQQALRGFLLGIEYATGDTNTVLGKRIEVVQEDDASAPQIGVQKGVKLLSEDKVDVLAGVVSSAIALAVMERAKEAKKVYIIGCAAVDQITGSNFNVYTFRVGRSLGQAAASAELVYDKKDILGLGKGEIRVAYLAPDYAGGRFGIAIAKAGAPERWKLVEELYAPLTTTDFTPYLQKIKAASPQVLGIITVGANFETKLPQQSKDLGLAKKRKINVGVGDMAFLKAVGPAGDGWIGECLYYYEMFDNPVNKWLITHHQKQYGTPPDFWSGNSFAAAIALIEGIKKAQSVEADALIKGLEGIEFWGPTSKDWKYRIRPADHQVMIGINYVRLTAVSGLNYAVPKMIYQTTPEESTPPVTAPGRENYGK
jgi:branched-chain amino acid transport system substrate-binding protein